MWKSIWRVLPVLSLGAAHHAAGEDDVEVDDGTEAPSQRTASAITVMLTVDITSKDLTHP